MEQNMLQPKELFTPQKASKMQRDVCPKLWCSNEYIMKIHVKLKVMTKSLILTRQNVGKTGSVR